MIYEFPDTPQTYSLHQLRIKLDLFLCFFVWSRGLGNYSRQTDTDTVLDTLSIWPYFILTITS